MILLLGSRLSFSPKAVFLLLPLTPLPLHYSKSSNNTLIISHFILHYTPLQSHFTHHYYDYSARCYYCYIFFSNNLKYVLMHVISLALMIQIHTLGPYPHPHPYQNYSFA